MKRTLNLILAIVCILSMTMTGCGLFSSESTETGSGDVKLTEAYTYKDPEGLEFEKRYAFTSGESQEVAEGYKTMYDVDCTSEYVFIYADKDDVTVSQLDYWVFKTDEDAAKFIEAASIYGNGSMQQDGSVVWDTYDAEGVKDLVLMQQQYSGLESDKCSDYARFIKESYGYMDAQ